MVNGICQFNSLPCDISKDSAYDLKLTCGGPSERSCCRTPSNELTTIKTTIPTVSVTTETTLAPGDLYFV